MGLPSSYKRVPSSAVCSVLGGERPALSIGTMTQRLWGDPGLRTQLQSPTSPRFNFLGTRQ